MLDCIPMRWKNDIQRGGEDSAQSPLRLRRAAPDREVSTLRLRLRSAAGLRMSDATASVLPAQR